MGGVVFGAILVHDEVIHVMGTNKIESQRICGSKYLQSSMEGVYKQIENELSSNKKVLFTGCPCQCAAVEAMFKTRKNYNNLYLCEILCHGVPSPGIFKDWISYLENKYGDVVSDYRFRSKKNGWSRPTVEIYFENGKRIVQSHNESNYHMWFGRHLSLRPSCYKCKYRNIKRVADITLGDFWGIKALEISDEETEKGTSVLLVNTEKGMELLNKARMLNKIFLEKISIENAYVNNSPSLHNFARPKEREDFFDVYKNESIKGIIKKYPSENKAISILRKVKHILTR